MAISAPVRLNVELMERPIAVATAWPRFGWQLVDDPAHAAQSAYELEIYAADGSLVHRTGRVVSAQTSLVEVGVEVASRSTYRWRLRVWSSEEDISGWAESTFETTALKHEDWTASWIEPVQDPVTVEREFPFELMLDPDAVMDLGGRPEQRLHPAPIVRQSFELTSVPDAVRLRITAHGLYEARINGVVVGNEQLAPGYDAHPSLLSFQTYDVTALLSPGTNVVAVTLSDGWWAGRTSFSGTSGNYGDRLGLIWQLDAGANTLASSNASAVSSTGEIRYADIFIGEMHDARTAQPGWDRVGFDDSSWTPTQVVDTSLDAVVPFVGEPVRRVMTIESPTVVTNHRGETIVDLGQNIAGRLRLRAEGAAGTKITLEHTEALDAQGCFQTNILGRNKDQTDVWILAGSGVETFEPSFTFHGFRYVRVSGYPGVLGPDDVVGIVISSDLKSAGAFRTDDARINRLHENVVWSQRANFLSIPTDCPQRERAGWTGDIQVFARAATNNMGVDQFLTRWLTNVRAAQLPDGQVPNIVPYTPSFAKLLRERGSESSAGWGDAIISVPLALYERYGDRRVLQDNFQAMRRWHEYCRRTAETQMPARYEGIADEATRQRQRFLWNTGYHYGDWLAPSTLVGASSPLEAMSVAPRLTGEIVASMFYYRSTAELAGVAAVLGEESYARELEALAADIAQAFVEEFVDEEGRLTAHLQGTYVLALAFDLIPASGRTAAADLLVELIAANDYHLDTGFLSMPYLLDVLSSTGHDDVAYRILLQDTSPSWLYQVAHGATTIWETWDAVADDGTPGPFSLNHYAFGCVDDWLFRRVAGLQAASPGYGRAVVEPDLHSPFRHLSASLQTPHGRLSVAFQHTDAGARVSVGVPPNTQVELRLPGSERQELRLGDHQFLVHRDDLPPDMSGATTERTTT